MPVSILTYFFSYKQAYFYAMDRPPKKIVDSVISQLRKVRKRKRLSHETVAKRSKLHRSSVSLTEARKTEPTLVHLLQISRALDCSLGEILVNAEAEK